MCIAPDCTCADDDPPDPEEQASAMRQRIATLEAMIDAFCAAQDAWQRALASAPLYDDARRRAALGTGKEGT